jgi:NAD(P)-dependent dehydrogenase (short-subunit alcohol dehydrogenase family)
LSVGAVLVTGAGSGIGRAAASTLARHGWTVWVADINGGSAASVAEDIERSGGRARAAECDVADENQLAELAGRIERRDRTLDAVVANAAVFPRWSLADTDATVARHVFDVNLIGAIATVVAARPLLAIGGGSVVLVTSGSGGRSVARSAQQRGFALYGASKAALERWALGVCDELAADGIVVQMICPGGVVDTDGTRAVLPDAELAAGVGIDVVAEAIMRLCEVRDVGQTGARFLASDLRP